LPLLFDGTRVGHVTVFGINLPWLLLGALSFPFLQGGHRHAYPLDMGQALSIVVASYGHRPFELLADVVRRSGHRPVAYVVSRSMRPATPSEPEFVDAIAAVVRSIPDGIDLLLPGRSSGLAKQLPGYQPDLMIVFGFNWKLPPEVLSIPRFGVLNIHPSMLPKYRGPSPVLWAVRNGDTHFGVTIHRMNETIDAGPIMSRSAPIPLSEQVTHDDIWNRIAAVLPETLTDAIARVARGEPGEPQDAEQATYAGFPPDAWYTIDWTASRASIHHQLRAIRLLRPAEGVLTIASGRRIRLRGSSLDMTGNGLCVQCGDGPLRLTDWDDA
jgi:methionyl-tRNA formyltransferase